MTEDLNSRHSHLPEHEALGVVPDFNDHVYRQGHKHALGLYNEQRSDRIRVAPALEVQNPVQRAMYRVIRAIYTVKRAMYRVKRALSFVNRAIYSARRRPTTSSARIASVWHPQ